MVDDAIAGDVFSNYIESELIEERARRTSLDARGIGVLNTSGAFTTLLFALGAFAVGPGDAVLSWPALLLLGIASVAFVVAGLLGLLANRLQKYVVTTTAQMLLWRDSDKKWGDTPRRAKRALALANVRTIESLRKGNNTKASYIEAALWVQLGAILILTCAVAVVVID